jgi:eukaryotic-like serine/threonine-protein kinase
MSSPAPVPTKIRFDAFELDPASGELRKSGILLKLQPQPLRVLLLLIERAGQVVTREEIQRYLWTDSTFVDFEHGINFSINSIRRALVDTAEKPRYIETLPKRGYRFIGVVEQVSVLKQSAAPRADIHTSQSTEEVLLDPRRRGSGGLDSPSGSDLRVNSLPWNAGVSLGAVAIVLSLAMLGIYLWKSRHRAPNLEQMHIVRLTESGTAEEAAISPNGQYVVYVLREGEQRSLNVRQVASGSDVQILSPAVVELWGLTFSPDGNYIFFLRSPAENFSVDSLYQMPVLGGPQRELIRDIDTPVSFSPDGKQFAFVRIGPTDGTHLMVANADGTEERVLAKRPATSLCFPAWSPDGKTIVFAGPDLPGGDSHIWAVSPVDGNMQPVYTTRSQIGRALWLPNGRGMLATIRDSGQERGQIWLISYPGGEATRVTNDLTNYVLRALNLTQDGKSLVTIENTISSDLWVVPGGQAAHAGQLTSGRAGVRDISAGPERAIVFSNQKNDLYSIHEDGSALTLLTPKMHNNGNPSTCRDGRHIVFESSLDRGGNIWRMDVDGTHVTQLTRSGSALSPVCTPDSQSVQYFDLNGMKNWRVPISGGTPTQVDINNLAAVAHSFSPDSNLIAYNAFGPAGDVPNQILVIPAAGGKPLFSFRLRGDAALKRLRWTPDGSGLDYFLTNKGVGNIWRQPIPKGAPRQITKFTSGQIFSFDWSSDGKQLYVARGSNTSDIVLITNFQ